MSTPKLALTIPEAAQAAGVTERTIRAWIGQGLLRAKRQSRKVVDGKPTNDGTGKTLITVRALEDCLDALPDA